MVEFMSTVQHISRFRSTANQPREGKFMGKFQWETLPPKLSKEESSEGVRGDRKSRTNSGAAAQSKFKTMLTVMTGGKS